MNGNNAAPIYKFLKSSEAGPFWVHIKYNFSMFLVDKDGNVVERHTPLASPLSVEVKFGSGISFPHIQRLHLI